MIGTSPPPIPVPGTEPDATAARVVNLFPQSYRWWQLAAAPRGRDQFHIALSGLASDAVWRSSVAIVPCPDPTNASAGPCACSLHAPATAVARARSMSSLVVGGGVRVLSVDHGEPHRPLAVVAVEGPLHLLSWCAGDHDGFSLEVCPRMPRWVIPGQRSAALCRRHVHGLPRRVIDRRMPTTRFVPVAATALRRRYGVDVLIGFAGIDAPPNLAAAPARSAAGTSGQSAVADVTSLR